MYENKPTIKHSFIMSQNSRDSLPEISMLARLNDDPSQFADVLRNRYGFAQDELPLSYKFSSMILEYFILLICNADLYSVYKEVPRHIRSAKIKYRIYKNSHIKAPLNHKMGPQALWFRVLLRASRALVYYMTYRMCFGYCTYLYDVFGLGSKMIPQTTEAQLTMTHKIVAQSLGEPWASMNYVIVVTSGFYIIVLSFISDIYPIDASIYRFALEPWRELERFHLQIDRILLNITTSAELRLRCNRVAGSPKLATDQLRALHKHGEELSNERWICRPSLFRTEGFLDLQTKIFYTSLVVIATSTFFLLYVVDCIASSIGGYTWRNTWILCDLYLAQACWSSGVVFCTSVVFLVTRYQIDYARDLRSDIEFCVHQIRTDDIRVEAHSAQEVEQNSDSRLDKLLLQVLIKSYLCFEEVDNYQFVLTALMHCLTSLMLLVIVIVLTHMKMMQYKQLPVSNIPELFTILVWIIYNIFLLWCAEYHAKMQQAGKATSSLICAMQARAIRLNRILAQCDFVEARWRKLFLSDTLQGKRLAVNLVLGPITFRQILELNYAAVTIAAYMHFV